MELIKHLEETINSARKAGLQIAADPTFDWKTRLKAHEKFAETAHSINQLGSGEYDEWNRVQDWYLDSNEWPKYERIEFSWILEGWLEEMAEQGHELKLAYLPYKDYQTDYGWKFEKGEPITDKRLEEIEREWTERILKYKYSGFRNDW